MSITYRPPGIVISSNISRKNLFNNSATNKTKQTERLDEVEDFFQHFSKKMLYEIKKEKDHSEFVKITPLKKKKNFASEFIQVKKHFETDFTANTQIYQSLPQSHVNNKSIRDLNNEEYKLQISSSDKYLAMLDSRTNFPKTKGINKYNSFQNRNWMQGGAVITKVKVNSNSNCNGLAENVAPNENSVLNKHETKSRKKNEAFYTFAYTTAPSAARKEPKIKKKSFIEEFREARDKLEVKRKKTDWKDNSHLFHAETKTGDVLRDSSPAVIGKERKKINNNLITPFSHFETSFFSDFNPTETVKIGKRSNNNRADSKCNITADWVKGDLIKREENNAFLSYFLPSNQSDEEKSENGLTPKNDYSKVSLGYTLSDENRGGTQNEKRRLYRNQCTSAITMANSVQYSRNEVVITQTKVTKLTVFPSHLENAFQSHH